MSGWASNTVQVARPAKPTLNEHEKRMLISGSEEDIKIATALMANKDIVRKCIYDYENKDYWIDHMRLDLVAKLQTRYPEVVITGSIGLFLNGVRLERWKTASYRPDIDIIIPHFVLFEDGEDLHFKDETYKGSGNDFDSGMNIEYRESWYSCDIKICNTREYRKVNYNGSEYKVALPEDIITAKITYSKKAGGSKHRHDIREMIGFYDFEEHLKELK